MRASRSTSSASARVRVRREGPVPIGDNPCMRTRNASAVASARRAMALAGHPGVSWSILAEARMDVLPSPEVVIERLREAIEARPALGPAPKVVTAEGREAGALRAAFADVPYDERGALLRAALIRGHPPSVLVAAHHGVLDGLGLLALLGVATGVAFESSARGLAVRRPSLPFAISAALRAGEALLAPPARIEPAPGQGPLGPGDHLLAMDLPIGRVRTAAAVAAAVSAVREWNQRRGGQRGRIVVAVGASRRPGTELGLEERSAYLRIRIGATRAGASGSTGSAAADDEDAVRALLAAARPEPPAPAGRAVGVLAGPAGALAGWLSPRLGSTLLVSSLGSVHGPPGLRSVAFRPVAHGRSGVALGLATVGDTTTVTLRARRRDFEPDAAGVLLAAVADRLSNRAQTGTQM